MIDSIEALFYISLQHILGLVANIVVDGLDCIVGTSSWPEPVCRSSARKPLPIQAQELTSLMLVLLYLP